MADRTPEADGNADSSAPPLPELRTAELDDADLTALVRDLETLAVIEAIVFKGGAGGYAKQLSAPASLRDAIARLRAGAVRGVQIHYRWNAQRWCDTLLRTGQTIRLTRIACDFAAASRPEAD